jgi:hypothetical protein
MSASSSYSDSMALSSNSQSGGNHQPFPVASAAQYNILNFGSSSWKKNSKDQLIAPAFNGNTSITVNQNHNQQKQIYSSALGSNSNPNFQKRTKVFYSKKV